VADHEWVLVPGFTFDRVFPSPTGQAEIFDFGVKGIVEGKLGLIRSIVSKQMLMQPFPDVMSGFNGTLFCYGQTGSGKTVGLGLMLRYQDAY
jgi:kinesin family protein 5